MESARPLPSGTVTFLFTDIEGSTRLLQELGGAYAELLETHHSVLRRAVADAGGVPISTEGDALFAVFDSDLSALALDTGDAARALRLAGAASQLVATGGVDLGTLLGEVEGRDPSGVGGLDPEEIDALLAESRAMSIDQAIDYAMGWVAGLPGPN